MNRKSFIKTLAIGAAVPLVAPLLASEIFKEESKPDLESLLEDAREFSKGWLPGITFTHEHFTEPNEDPSLPRTFTWMPILVSSTNTQRIAYFKVPLSCVGKPCGSKFFDGKICSCYNIHNSYRNEWQREPLSSPLARKEILHQFMIPSRHAAYMVPRNPLYNGPEYMDMDESEYKFITVVTSVEFPNSIGICSNNFPMRKYSKPPTWWRK